MYESLFGWPLGYTKVLSEPAATKRILLQVDIDVWRWVLHNILVNPVVERSAMSSWVVSSKPTMPDPLTSSAS